MPGKVLRQGIGEVEAEIGIILALKEEFTELLQEIGERYHVRQAQASNSYYYLFAYTSKHTGRSWKCAATFVGDMGPVQAGLATQQFINDVQPRILVLLGIAGALDSQLRLGDVVIADQVDAYLENSQAAGAQEDSAYHIRFSGQVYRGSADLVNFARHFEFAHPQLYREWREQCKQELSLLLPAEQMQRLKRRRLIREAVSIFEGHLASGSVVAASSAYINQLKTRDRHYLAVEMEAAGLLAAVNAQASPVHTLIMRAVSDYADAKKATLDMVQGGALRRYATRNVVHLLWQFFEADLPLTVRQPAQAEARLGEGADAGAPIKLVYLYAARDHVFRQQVALALAPFFAPGGLVVQQYDYQLDPDTREDAEALRPLPTADLVVVLLSPDLPASEQNAQLTEVLARQRARTARVVPVLVRALEPGRALFAELSALPSNGQAISEWTSRPQALLDVARGIYHILEGLRASSP
jgi:nucleoside phosphorylase